MKFRRPKKPKPKPRPEFKKEKRAPPKAPVKRPIPDVDLDLPKQQPPTKARVPGIWQHQLAGACITRPKGPGEERLDELCRSNGLTWGIVATYCDGKDLRTSVLVGRVFDGGAERLIEQSPTNHWNEVDIALGDIAKQIEEDYGGEG